MQGLSYQSSQARNLCRAFSPRIHMGTLTEGFALGWYVAAPLALSGGR
jgi:hypothetical protein